MEMLGLGFVSLLIASMVAGLVAWMVWLKRRFLDECRRRSKKAIGIKDTATIYDAVHDRCVHTLY